MDIKFVEKSDMIVEEISEVLNKLDCAIMFLQPKPKLATVIGDELSGESFKKYAKQLAEIAHDSNLYMPIPSFIPEPSICFKE